MTSGFNKDIIRKAPITPKTNKGETLPDLTDINDLRNKNSQLQDEYDRLQKEITVESQKARLIIPYANKVFYFCSAYSIAAFVIICLHGSSQVHFKLHESTLNYVAGTNLASVIGLLAIILTGIYSSK